MKKPSRIKHGTRAGYVELKCRCEPCSKANREYQKQYLRNRVAAGLVDSHGKVKR